MRHSRIRWLSKAKSASHSTSCARLKGNEICVVLLLTLLNIISNSLHFPLSFALHTESGAGDQGMLVGFVKKGGAFDPAAASFDLMTASYPRSAIGHSRMTACKQFGALFTLFIF